MVTDNITETPELEEVIRRLRAFPEATLTLKRTTEVLLAYLDILEQKTST